MEGWSLKREQHRGTQNIIRQDLHPYHMFIGPLTKICPANLDIKIIIFQDTCLNKHLSDKDLIEVCI